MRRLPTAPIAAGVFVASWATVAASGSRPLGGVVLAGGGLWCMREWRRRNDTRTALELGGVCLLGFIASHVLALAIGSWPSVLVVAAVSATLIWMRADTRTAGSAPALAFRPPTR